MIDDIWTAIILSLLAIATIGIGLGFVITWLVDWEWWAGLVLGAGFFLGMVLIKRDT